MGIQPGNLIGTRSADHIRASGHVIATTGRTHDLHPTASTYVRFPLQRGCRSLIAAPDASAIFLDWFFFCPAAQSAFFRPGRKAREPARAGAVKAGRSPAATVRLGLDSVEHDGILEMPGLTMAPSCSGDHAAFIRVWSVCADAQGHGSLRGQQVPPQHPVRRAGAAMSTTGTCELHGPTASVAVTRTFAPGGNASGPARSDEATNGPAKLRIRRQRPGCPSRRVVRTAKCSAE